MAITARRHFLKKEPAQALYTQKKAQGYNVGALRLPIRGQREWIVFWSPGIINTARATRA